MYSIFQTTYSTCILNRWDRVKIALNAVVNYFANTRRQYTEELLSKTSHVGDDDVH